MNHVYYSVMRIPDSIRPVNCLRLVIAAAVCVSASVAFAQDETVVVEGAAGTLSARRVVRPLLGEEVYGALARTLRAQYAQPAEKWPAPVVDKDVKWAELGRNPRAVFPKENPFSAQKAELGRLLFFDARLSANRQMSCATCHEPNLSFTDARQATIGKDGRPLKRNAPTLMNAGLNEFLFWDGRAASLEAQAIDALTNEQEMNSDEKTIIARLSALPEYRKKFAAAFGDAPGSAPGSAPGNAPDSDKTITMERTAQAIATFVRTIVGGRSRFDQFVSGRTDALSDEAVRGLHLFRTEARCMNCHNGPNFTDGRFHDLGLSYYGRSLEDLGRYHITKDSKDVGRFKTPTLRDVMRTSPYMHVGLFEIDGVLNLYNAGMPTLRRKPGQKDDPLFPVKSELLRPLGLNRQDMTDIKAFLESLTEPRRMVRVPELPKEEQGER